MTIGRGMFYSKLLKRGLNLISTVKSRIGAPVRRGLSNCAQGDKIDFEVTVLVAYVYRFVSGCYIF